MTADPVPGASPHQPAEAGNGCAGGWLAEAGAACAGG
jgi:hypothetical protein